MKVYSSENIGLVAAGWPVVLLKVSPNGTTIVVAWGDTTTSREQPVTLQPGINYVAVIRTNGRLGVWANSAGSWLLDSVWCVPDRQAVTYCTKGMTSPAAEPDTTFRALRCVFSSQLQSTEN